MTTEWFDDIELLCNQIRENAILLDKLHKKQYFAYKSKLKYFRIPSIILNGFNSVLAVSMANYVNQSVASTTTCAISLFIAILASVEVYLNIQKGMENEFAASKEYYLLAVEIFKILNVDRSRRSISGKDFLEDIMNRYRKLIEQTNLSQTKIPDTLVPLELVRMGKNSSMSSLFTPSTPTFKFDMGSSSGSENSEGGNIMV
jgi:hypothetical protein